uniref:Transmembrane protein 188 n=1 Tax=Syphacia muris TaxID=451379 RepID=A0A0N5A847_9BILA
MTTTSETTTNVNTRENYPEELRRWEMQYSSTESLDSTRIPVNSYEEIKKLIILAGIFFMVAILFFLMKLEVPLEVIFKWSPIVWLLGVLMCCLLMNFLCYCRRLYKRRREMNRRQQELLMALNLTSTYPCLRPVPHQQCCETNAQRLLLPTDSLSSLPSYNQAVASSGDYPMFKISFPRVIPKKPPPSYDDALRMTNQTPPLPPYS